MQGMESHHILFTCKKNVFSLSTHITLAEAAAPLVSALGGWLTLALACFF